MRAVQGRGRRAHEGRAGSGQGERGVSGCSAARGREGEREEGERGKEKKKKNREKKRKREKEKEKERGEKRERNKCVGADRGERSRVADSQPSGAGWDGGEEKEGGYGRRKPDARTAEILGGKIRV